MFSTSIAFISTMYSQTTAPQKIHVRNLFKIFVPLRGENNFSVKLNTTPVFGVVVHDKDDTNISYEYQLHMLLRERSYTQGIETESEAVGCFSWAKRNPVLVHTEQNTNNIEGILLRVKVNHGIFDFRKTSRQLIRIVVNLKVGNQYVRQGTSILCKLLPKKRKADKTSENTEAEIAISWPDGQTLEAQQYLPVTQSELNNISTHHFDSTIEVDESPEVRQFSMTNLFEQPSSMLMQEEVETTNIFTTPASEENEQHDEQYMVLYNGNAEVVGNFRALNFYKASDINIKEDVSLLVEDNNPRDVLLKISGVSYKFKPGTTHSTQRRFVGYIAQQIESVVPEAVQLIDGILHVDYESLIPYLSESIKQNFTDIQGLKSDTQKLEALLNELYEEFTQGESKVKSNVTSKSKLRPEKSRVNEITGLVKSKWQWFAGLLFLALIGITVALSMGLVAKFRDQPDEPEHAPSLPDYGNPEGYLEGVARTALKTFYESMNGDNWIIKTNWMSNTSVCEWYGVTCDGPFEEEHVTEVRLSNNNLTGGLLGQYLMYKVAPLKVLDLSKNNILFSIHQLSPYITHLNLSENQISTDIKVFNQLTYIRSLNLAHTRVYGDFQLLPSQLVRLKELNVSHTSITTIARTDGEYEIEVCDWHGTTLHCPIPDWIQKCGGTCV